MVTESHLLERPSASAGTAVSARLAGPARGTRLRTGGTVVALRHGRVVGLGGLVDHAVVDGSRLVPAEEPDGTSWWIPAAAVWCDGESTDAAEHPRRIGLATGTSVAGAVVQGLSDRLGWEAVCHLEAGHDLPALEPASDLDPEHFVVLDGRLGHDVPTVVVVGAELTCWGAGSTWAQAFHRAIYGVGAADAVSGELTALITTLAEADLRPVTVDLGSPRLRQHGIVRVSVQLLSAT